jgi:hypothetical protein
MPTLFKLAYSLVVAILLILFVILGIRTFYDEPEAPPYPGARPYLVRPPPSEAVEESIYCESDGRCFKGGRELTEADEAKLTEEERLYLQEQRQFEEQQRKYEDDRVDYSRNVFILASVLGVAAVAGGLYLFRRVEAMPLGLLLGGLGVVIYGWVEAAEDFDEIGAAPMFAVVAVGLGIVLAAGYRFLGLVRPTGGDGGDA